MSKKNRQRNKGKTQAEERKALQIQRGGEAIPPGLRTSPYQGTAKRRDVALAFKAARVGAISEKGHEEEDDPFWESYRAYSDLVEPLFPFTWCWQQYYQSDILGTCVDVVAENCANPYQFDYAGAKADKTNTVNTQIAIDLGDFFSRVNEKEAWAPRMVKKIIRSREIVNCAFVNVIRGEALGKDDSGKWGIIGRPPERLYYIPSPHMRATTLDNDAVPVPYMMPRGGKLVRIVIARKFRKFARINPQTQAVTWFKELHDPRELNSKTGEFVNYVIQGDKLINKGETEKPATEIWFLRKNSEGQVYGTPWWVSCLWSLRGRSEAMWINFDHLDQGAIPPGLFAFMGGKPSEATKKTLNDFVGEIRDPSFYNRIPWIEMESPESLDLDEGPSGRTSRIEYVKLRDPQHEDFMFGQYDRATERHVRQRRRLPPILTGATDEATFASSYTQMEIAESQVLVPERADLDERVTVDLIQNGFQYHGWSIKTGGSKIGDKETFYRAVGALSRAGALTVNNVRELANQLLGTSLPPFEGDLYNEPLTLVSTLAQNGLVGYDEAKKALAFMQAIAATTGQIGEKFRQKLNEGNVGKSEIKQQAIEAVKEIVDNLVGLAALHYRAPTEVDIEFELLPEPETEGKTDIGEKTEAA